MEDMTRPQPVPRTLATVMLSELLANIDPNHAEVGCHTHRGKPLCREWSPRHLSGRVFQCLQSRLTSSGEALTSP